MEHLEHGYIHAISDEFVTNEEAYEYALEKCLHGEDHEEFKEMLVEWYFSGNWLKASRSI